MTHHQWCIRAGTVTEGVCMVCEHLHRQYPSLGHLDYMDAMYQYFPEFEVGTSEICCNLEDKTL